MSTQSFVERYGTWALVLGGSEGLGKAIANELAGRGMNVAILARREHLLRETARQLAETHGVETKIIPFDLGKPNAVEAVEQGLDGIEISFMVYNAADEPWGVYLDQDISVHDYNIAVNVISPTHLTHHFGRKMRERGKGGIVICSSLAAMQGIYSYVSYGAAKSYEMLLGEGLWDEMADFGVDACTFMVGATYTPNFVKSQQRKNGLFAHSRTPAGVPKGVKIPQLPEEAAARLFANLAGEWQPMIFADEEDQIRDQAMKTMPRASVIKRISGAMRTGFRTAMDEDA